MTNDDPTIGVLVERIIDKLRGAIAYRLCVAVQADDGVGQPTTDVAVYISGVEVWHEVYQGILLLLREHLGDHLGIAALQGIECYCKSAAEMSIRMGLDRYLDGEATAADLRWETVLEDIAKGRDTVGLRLTTDASYYAVAALRHGLIERLSCAATETAVG